MKFLAKFISVVFQPLLMPTLVFYTYLFHIDNSSNLLIRGKLTVLSLIFITTCLIPTLTILMFRFTKVVKDLQMINRKDRFLPFVFISIFYVVVTYLMTKQTWFNPVMTVGMISITTVVVLVNVITFFWKISAHAAGIAGWLGFILAFSKIFAGNNTLLMPLFAAVLLAGAVVWARLYLNAHKPIESLAGFIMGFVVCYGSILLFL